MTYYLYAYISSLAVIFAQFLIGSLKRFLIQNLLLLFSVRRLHLEYSSSDNSDESNEEEPDEPGSESGSAGTFGTGLGGLLRGVEITLGVTISADESCNGDAGSLFHK